MATKKDVLYLLKEHEIDLIYRKENEIEKVYDEHRKKLREFETKFYERLLNSIKEFEGIKCDFSKLNFTRLLNEDIILDSPEYNTLKNNCKIFSYDWKSEEKRKIQKEISKRFSELKTKIILDGFDNDLSAEIKKLLEE